jgi:hypothetical protein
MTKRNPRGDGAGVLRPEHQEYFASRGIDPEYAVRQGAYSVDGGEGALLLGLTKPLASGAIAFVDDHRKPRNSSRPDQNRDGVIRLA